MPNVYLANIPNLAGLVLSPKHNDPLVYRKEVIYTGDFTKPTDKLEFSVDRARLDSWHNTVTAMLANGVEIPVPKNHSDDPDMKRGTVIGTEIDKNAAGLDALFAFVKFNDTAAANIGKNNNVSLYSPPEFIDGKGNKYVQPIQHIALTDYPVIPGLGKFEAIALSFNDKPAPPEKKPMPFDYKPLAKKLALADNLTDDTAPAAIDAAIDALTAKANPVAPVPIAAAFINLAADSRNTKIDGLVKTAKISPAVAADLKLAFAVPAHLTLSLSLDSKGELKASDNFDNVVAALAKNEVVKLGEQTGPQLELGPDGKTILLSNRGTQDSETNNALTRNADARAKK